MSFLILLIYFYLPLRKQNLYQSLFYTFLRTKGIFKDKIAGILKKHSQNVNLVNKKTAGVFRRLL